MSAEKDPILSEICNRLKAEFNPKKIYLFGSRARGDNGADSDYDLLLIIESSKVDMVKRNIRARSQLWDVKASVDVFVYTQTEFDEMKTEFNSIAEIAMNEGKELMFG